MRNHLINELTALAKKDKDIMLIAGDLGFGVLNEFMETLPDQFINAGICEQNMASVAAGLALEGKKVYVYSIGNFPGIRCLEQVRNDICYHNANVKIIVVGGGFAYGQLGMSHHATEDIAIMRALPDVTVVCPGDPLEAEQATMAIAEYPGTCYLRLGRGGEKRVHQTIQNFKLGKAIKICDCPDYEKKIAIFSTGAILDAVTEAVVLLQNNKIGVEQYSFPTVKPIDKDVVIDCANRYQYVVTVEEHNTVGGFGSAVAEIMAEHSLNAKLIRIGINDEYCTIVGSQQYLREKYGISAKQIAARIMGVLSS